MQRTPRALGIRPDEKQTATRNIKVANIAIIALSGALATGLGFVYVQGQQGASVNMVTAANYTAPPVTVAPGKATLFMGDSYTAGTGAKNKSDRWSSIVAREMGWFEGNIALGGTGYATTAGREGCGRNLCPDYPDNLTSYAALRPERVVIAGGQNDFRAYQADPARVEEGVDRTFEVVRKHFPDAELIVLGPSTTSNITEHVRGLDAAVQKAAEGAGGQYISLIEPNVIDSDMVLSDGGHVNNSGHAAIAARVLDAVRD